LIEEAEADEALLVRAPDHEVEVLHGLADRDALLHRLLVVDDELVLRVVGRVEGEEAGQLGALAQRRHELLVDAVELVVVGAAGLLEHTERHAAGRAVAGHRGRLEELDDRADVLRALLELRDDLVDRLVALGPVLQVDEAGPGVGGAPLGEDLVAGEGRDGRHLGHLPGDVLQRHGDRVGALERGARRGLDDRVDDALVLVGDEAGTGAPG
jgi:hypothetical protein